MMVSGIQCPVTERWMSITQIRLSLFITTMVDNSLNPAGAFGCDIVANDSIIIFGCDSTLYWSTDEGVSFSQTETYVSNIHSVYYSDGKVVVCGSALKYIDQWW